VTISTKYSLCIDNLVNWVLLCRVHISRGSFFLDTQ